MGKIKRGQKPQQITKELLEQTEES